MKVASMTVAAMSQGETEGVHDAAVAAAVGDWRLAIGSSVVAIGYWLVAISPWLLAIGCRPFGMDLGWEGCVEVRRIFFVSGEIVAKVVRRAKCMRYEYNRARQGNGECGPGKR